MNRRTQQRSAAWLALVAAFGLVVAPVVHAELHAREASLTRKQALALIFKLAFDQQRTAGQDQLLQAALERAFPVDRSAPARQRPHGHSHGPGRHGSGSLAHFDVALHGAPPPPGVLPPAPLAEGRLFAQHVLLFTARYTTPERAQAPPAA